MIRTNERRRVFGATVLTVMIVAGAPCWAVGDDSGAAEGARREWTAVTIYAENDSKAMLPNDQADRYYTNGTAVSVAGRPAWADGLAGHLPFDAEFGQRRTAAGVIFGHLMFTPQDIRAKGLIRNDHPYAGYMYLGGYLQRANEQTLDHFQLDLGMVGPSAEGEKLQKFVHNTLQGIDLQGWDNQLKDEPTVNLYVRKKWRWDLLSAETGEASSFAVQGLPYVGGAVGTVNRYLEAGGTLRVGWNLPNDFGPGRLADVGSATGMRRYGEAGSGDGLGQSHRDGFGVYAFGRATGRAVEHNLFVEGNNFRSSHGRPLEPLIGEFQYGVSLRYQRETWTVELGYSQTYVTRQFDRQAHNDSYGAYTLSVHMGRTR